MKRILLILFVLTLFSFLTGCGINNEFDESEEERTLNGTIYERAYQQTRTYKNKSGNKTYHYYFVFDEDSKKVLLNYGHELPSCSIYEGIYEGDLDSKKGVILHFSSSNINDDFEEFNIYAGNVEQTWVKYELQEIKTCLDYEPEHYYK